MRKFTESYQWGNFYGNTEKISTMEITVTWKLTEMLTLTQFNCLIQFYSYTFSFINFHKLVYFCSFRTSLVSNFSDFFRSMTPLLEYPNFRDFMFNVISVSNIIIQCNCRISVNFRILVFSQKLCYNTRYRVNSL